MIPSTDYAVTALVVIHCLLMIVLILQHICMHRGIMFRINVRLGDIALIIRMMVDGMGRHLVVVTIYFLVLMVLHFLRGLHVLLHGLQRLEYTKNTGS